MSPAISVCLAVQGGDDVRFGHGESLFVVDRGIVVGLAVRGLGWLLHNAENPRFAMDNFLLNVAAKEAA